MTKSQFSKYCMVMLVSILFSTTATLQAQGLKVVPTKSNIVISGTSTLHAWDMKVAQINGEVAANTNKQLISLVVKVPVKSMKSAEGSIMDGKAYDAFDAKKNPFITFTLTEAAPVKITDKDVEVTLVGNLSMGGATKKVSFKAAGKLTGNVFELKGAVPVKMSEYGMKAPTAVFGTIKCGDAVTVKFVITVEGNL